MTAMATTNKADCDSISSVLEDAKVQLNKIKEWEGKLQHASSKLMDKENAVNLDDATEKYQQLRKQWYYQETVEMLKERYETYNEKTNAFKFPDLPDNHDYEQAHLDELTKLSAAY